MFFVADVMTTDLITLNLSDSLKAARGKMKQARIRHLPVLSPQAEFVGILSQRDLLKATLSHFADVHPDEREQLEAGIPVSEVMSVDVLTVSPDMPLSKAGELLLVHKFGCLPVLDGTRLLGILTESDFVRLCLVFLKQAEADGEHKPLQ